MLPEISSHFQSRMPSAIRQAQIIFSKRKDKNTVDVINLAIGNVPLPMHPAMIERLNSLGTKAFNDGIVKYTPSVGIDEARKAFLNIIASEGVNTSNLNCMITDGGSQAMELMMLGVCGPSSSRPLMLLDPTYTNYIEFGNRLSIKVKTYKRELLDNGYFNEIDLEKLDNQIKIQNPGALVIIPSDNPTGQFLSQDTIVKIAKICLKNNTWLVSDEAYRQLYYNKEDTSSSIWRINDKDIPGITGSRISIESASKVWNACGLRVGALVTDNLEFHNKAVYEYTANLCANNIGQYIFGSLAHETHENLNKWYAKQRKYYRSIMVSLKENLLKELPGLIVTNPAAAIYLVIDFKNICDKNFNAEDFVRYCSSKGKVLIDDIYYTLLLAPMGSFYSDSSNGKTQLRIAMVEPKYRINYAPKILSSLYNDYLQI